MRERKPRGAETGAAEQPGWAGWMWAPLVLLVVIAYARTISFGFFQDDYLLARPWTLAEAVGAFHGQFDPTQINQPYFRPLAPVAFALEWGVWGTTLWGYHLTNIALHALVTVGLWHVLKLLGVRWWAASIGAAYFAIVPSNAAAVVYIAHRTDAMVALAILTGMGCIWRYSRTGRRQWLVYLNLAYVFALLSKEVGVAMVPFATAFWLFLNVEPREAGSAGKGRAPGSLMQHWAGELMALCRPAMDTRVLRDSIPVLGPLVACTALYLLYRGLVMPPGSFLDRFGEGLNPARALFAAMRGTFKGVPWQIYPRTELPLLAAFALGLITCPRARGWRVVALGVACIAAGVLPLCFNGGVEPRLMYVAELGMGIAVAGLATVYGEALSAARTPVMRMVHASAFGAVALVVAAVVGSSLVEAQDVYAPGSALHLEGDLRVWVHVTSTDYVPQENLEIVESNLRLAGLIDEHGQLTPAADAIPHHGPPGR